MVDKPRIPLSVLKECFECPSRDTVINSKGNLVCLTCGKEFVGGFYGR